MLGGLGGVVGGAMGFAAANRDELMLRDRIGATDLQTSVGK